MFSTWVEKCMKPKVFTLKIRLVELNDNLHGTRALLLLKRA